MGFGFNYTWLSLHGHLSFSNTPVQFPEYPLKFPIENWPRDDDPSFIGQALESIVTRFNRTLLLPLQNWRAQW